MAPSNDFFRTRERGPLFRLCASLVLLTGLSLLFSAPCAAVEGGPGAVTARPVVAPPPPNTAVPASIYGQQADRALPAAGISVQEKPAEGAAGDDLDDYDSEPAASIADPLEGWNRFWFRFNDFFYIHVANPVYKGWETVTPREVRSGLSNFWHNLLFPMRFVNNLLQGRFQAAGVEFGRFIINTTAGFGGFIDVSRNLKTVVPVHPEGESFGQTLGVWGVGHGCYLIWPFLGPSSVRETFGWGGDYFLYPGFALGYVWDVPWYAITGIEAGFFFNDLDKVLPTYTALTDAAVDPYIMMREAWVRHRAVQVAR